MPTWTETVSLTMEHFTAWKTNTKLVVPDSIPILYFGNSKKYQESKIKVMTVGLNPSDQEFPKRHKTQRFKYESLDINNSYDDDFTESYREILDSYFLNCPYNWFDDSFGDVLDGFGASYYKDAPITAVHTDIATPIPTSPTWSGIGTKDNDLYWQDHKKVKDNIAGEGLTIFRALIELLKPDIMFVSVQKKLLDRLPNEQIVREEDGETLLEVLKKKDGTSRKKSYKVILQRYSLAIDPAHKIALIYGEAAQTPFGLISNKSKHDIGEKAREWYQVQYK